MCNRAMKYLTFLILVFSLSANAVSVRVLSNEEIKEKYGIRIELAEKSIENCNDYVIYAPSKIEKEGLGIYFLEKVGIISYASVPNQNQVLTENNYKSLSLKNMGAHARILGCVKKGELNTSFFRFLYINEGSPSVILVAPLM